VTVFTFHDEEQLQSLSGIQTFFPDVMNKKRRHAYQPEQVMETHQEHTSVVITLLKDASKSNRILVDDLIARGKAANEGNGRRCCTWGNHLSIFRENWY